MKSIWRDSAQENTPKPGLSHSALLVLKLIRGFSKGAWGYCGAFQRTLAARLGRSIRWLAYALDELKRFGVLVVQQRGPHAAAYRLDSKKSAELLQSFERPSLFTEMKDSNSYTPTSQNSQNLPRRIQKTLWRAARRIRSAENPQAYEKAIIASEFRAIEAEKQRESARIVAAPPVFVAPFRGLGDLFDHLRRIEVI